MLKAKLDDLPVGSYFRINGYKWKMVAKRKGIVFCRGYLDNRQKARFLTRQCRRTKVGVEWYDVEVDVQELCLAAVS